MLLWRDGKCALDLGSILMEEFQFHPAIAKWFEGEFGSPSEPQQRGWPAIQAGDHVLISAPTGSGKTLAAFLASLDQLFREALTETLPDETRVLYVSPLKALSNDIHKNLERPLTAIRHSLKDDHGHEVDVRAEVRTGDTPAAKRQSIIKKPPHILVTTPESFYLLLTSESGRKLLAPVRTVIVDEIHAVISNRRGSHLALSIERLAALAKHPLQRIGLSATQKPIEEVARFLTGTNEPPCTIVNCDYRRQLDVAIELPGSPLEAVMSNEIWEEVYGRLAELIAEHETTLVFTNTRRLAERVAHNLGSRIGTDKVTSHHGSLSAKLRLEAENRLKRGELKALVATASLELGIDIGSIGLVCQIGRTHSLATFLQRIGRAEHRRGGLPKGRIFPLSRDELVEVTALLRGIRNGELDALQMPQKPIDVLAQQIVACAASGDWKEGQLFELMRSAYPYRELTRKEFDDVVRMLAEGFSTKRGRRGALLHRDAINRRLRGRRGARLVALTSGGAIPDSADFRVVLEPTETCIGTVNEDFAVESMASDIFQLGNASWRILKVDAGAVRVEDAHGQPPGMPFWLGEAPGRTDELSEAVSRLRFDVEEKIRRTLEKNGGSAEGTLVELFKAEPGLPASGAQQLADYFAAIHRTLGTIPSQRRLVLERFFDESGGMQLVVHSPFGVRVNRAWGLALRKRFCRSFNFELQAAATEDAIVLSLGMQHSFPLDDVFHFLNTNTVRELLIQALLDAPMFAIRWRWNATRSLALPRQRNGHKTPAQLQRMESENLLAAVFPDQLACLENIAGDRVVPEHPLVDQTITDCLTEAMDFDGLDKLLKRIEAGAVELIARDLPEPSPLAHEILNAKPYAFLDNAPLEERRTQAVYLRRAADTSSAGLGILDSAAIEKVCAEAWPLATNADELHEALLLIGVMTESEIRKTTGGSTEWLDLLEMENRVAAVPSRFFAASERLAMLHAIYGERVPPPPTALDDRAEPWKREDAIRELVRGRMEVCGPITTVALAQNLELTASEIDLALLALEGEGFVLRGKFNQNASEIEWCDRRLLARIHRLTIHRLRAEIEAVSLADFHGFLLAWQRGSPDRRVEGPEGVKAVLELLDGYEMPAAAWEPEALALRVNNYAPAWLDQLCFTGRIGWCRLTSPQNANGSLATPVRSSPISIYGRENLPHWLSLSAASQRPEFSPDAADVLHVLESAGALFFGEIVRRIGSLPSRVEIAIAELAANGWVTSDSFEGLRALLVPDDKRQPFTHSRPRKHHRAVTSIEFAGRWSAVRSLIGNVPQREQSLEIYARTLLRRYGVIFRRMLERESLRVPWFELLRIYRQLEARGEVRGGYFVGGVSGEQFALPEAVGLLRSLRRTRAREGERSPSELITISAADPLNLVGVLSPGPRIAAITAHRILLRDGVPVAALKAGQLISLEAEATGPAPQLERTLRVGSLSPALRPYYA
jgi:ATP-dependent helicase Lhr and Lhr-like helicase